MLNKTFCSRALRDNPNRPNFLKVMNKVFWFCFWLLCSNISLLPRPPKKMSHWLRRISNTFIRLPPRICYSLFLSPPSDGPAPRRLVSFPDLHQWKRRWRRPQSDSCVGSGSVKTISDHLAPFSLLFSRPLFIRAMRSDTASASAPAALTACLSKTGKRSRPGWRWLSVTLLHWRKCHFFELVTRSVLSHRLLSWKLPSFPFWIHWHKPKAS